MCIRSKGVAMYINRSVFSLSGKGNVFVGSGVLRGFCSDSRAIVPGFLYVPSFLTPRGDLVCRGCVRPVISSSLSCLVLGKRGL